jgi:DNA-binding NarL/FixJ family response regulator
VGNGLIYHTVKRPGGIHVAAARCDECLFYKLTTRSYVLGTPMIINGRLRVIVADTRAVKRLLGEHVSQVIKAEPLSPADATLTKRQREVLSALANGHNISSAARESTVSKVAVYKTFKKTLRKLTQLIS